MEVRRHVRSMVDGNRCAVKNQVCVCFLDIIRTDRKLTTDCQYHIQVAHGIKGMLRRGQCGRSHSSPRLSLTSLDCSKQYSEQIVKGSVLKIKYQSLREYIRIIVP